MTATDTPSRRAFSKMAAALVMAPSLTTRMLQSLAEATDRRG